MPASTRGWPIWTPPSTKTRQDLRDAALVRNYEWKRREACAEKGVTAILGVGFDPGVVNAYARYGIDTFLDEVESIDIVDINAGSHGRWFSTNFDPEINFREFTGTVYSWQNGAWQANKMFEVGKRMGPAGGGQAEGLSDRP
jgi:saccharopine dehydrogenase-like NADP-dependent oxidoreductase